MNNERSLFDKIGGFEILKKVHKIFYDKIYADEWLGQFFKEIKQETIENQQTDFMAQAMGGPQKYSGAFPIPAHKHMNISAELFEYRHQLLKASLLEAGLADENIEAWLKIDGAFRRGIVKASLSECEPRFKTDDILDFPKPGRMRKAS